jgi:hypothetical protein
MGYATDCPTRFSFLRPLAQVACSDQNGPFVAPSGGWGTSAIPLPSGDKCRADFRAAQALFEAQVASYWPHALAGTLNDDTLLAEGI